MDGSELGSRTGTNPPLDVGKSSDPSNQVGNLRSTEHNLFSGFIWVVTVVVWDLGGSS